MAAIMVALGALALGAWTATALWYQAAAGWRGALMGLVFLLAVAFVPLSFLRPGKAAAGLVLALMAVGLWWAGIAPSNSRDWEPDVARGVTADVEGSRVTLHNVRDFQWRTEEDFKPRWETLTFDLDHLDRVDVYSSVWASPAIAHTLVGFGFSDGKYVVFSAEIRRERGEKFSEIGGFFKQFELVLIAAAPGDIIHLRTDARGERVSRYCLHLTKAQMRAAFLIFAAKGNRLAEHPQFYQTLTTNCTTVVFQLARLVEPGIPFDWRILLSGYLPGYLHEHGLIAIDLPLGEAERAAVLAPGAMPWAEKAPPAEAMPGTKARSDPEPR